MHRTPLHDWHTTHGGRMVDFAGWDMPIQYTSIFDEHQAVRQRAGLFDIAHMGRLRFAGPDAARFLDRLLTNDATRLKLGQVRYSLVCNADGGILDDVLVYRFETSYLLVVNASNREKIIGWIGQHRGSALVQLVDETFDTFMLALQGPSAARLLEPHVDVALDAMKYYTAAKAIVCGIPATISRTGYTGEDGFEVIVAADAGRRLWETLVAAGRDVGLVPCGLGCRDTLRLEAAMPLYGHEMDECVDPLTAGLAFGVRLEAGDFIGRPAQLAMRDQPARRKRIGLKLEGRRIAREGAVICHEGHDVGRVTSGTFSPTLQQSIAMGYVESSVSNAGTGLVVDVRGQQVPATVVELPFYLRSGE